MAGESLLRYKPPDNIMSAQQQHPTHVKALLQSSSKQVKALRVHTAIGSRCSRELALGLNGRTLIHT